MTPLKSRPAQPNLIPLSDFNFTEDAVTEALDKTKVNKTSGSDCIAPVVLNQAKYQFSKPLTMLFNKDYSQIFGNWQIQIQIHIQNTTKGKKRRYQITTD